jgi:hypothetical protein
MQALESAAFLLVTERTLWVQSEPQQQDAQHSGSGPAANGAAASAGGGNGDTAKAAGPAADGSGSRTAPPQLLWLNAAEVDQQLGLRFQDGAFLSGAPNCKPWPSYTTAVCCMPAVSVVLEK